MIGRRETIAAIAGSLVLPRAVLAAGPRMFKASIRVEDDRVLIAVGMNGKGPYIFMIDTGTYVSLIRPDLAKQLKLLVQGQERTSGIGGNDIYNVYLARDFVIGGSIRQASVVLEDSFEFGYRSEIYGALAAGILTSVDTDLDFDAGELRIYPDGRGDRPGFVALDAEIPRLSQPNRGSRKIVASLLLDWQPIRCVLDTGSPHALTLNGRTARRLGLWNEARAYVPLRPRGIGGVAPIGRIVRAASLAMGDARAERPLITLLGDDVGSAIDGIVGLSFIRRYNLSIDARAGRLWVKPSAQVVGERSYGLSGLWLDQKGDGIVVAAVGAGSPAAGAGIAVGDRVTGTTWQAAIGLLGGPAGRTVKLTIERGGVRRDAAFTLQPYL